MLWIKRIISKNKGRKISFRGVNSMQKCKKSESNAQQANIGTKRMEPSDKNKGVKQEKRN